MGASETIMALFQYTRTLRFGEMRQKTGLRSNLLAYTLKRLVEQGILTKGEHGYELAKSAEQRILVARSHDAPNPLPVILVRCKNEEQQVLLLKRTKRPYDGLWGFPGGRMRSGETIESAAKRVLKTKTFVDCAFKGIHAVCNERVIEGGATQHAFILFIIDVQATSSVVDKEGITWIAPILVNQERIVPSDHFFLTAPPGMYEAVLTPRTAHEYDGVITPITGETPFLQQ
jgi:ADP-ribose pyrophosphatase YjhB (NUDIX family)